MYNNGARTPKHPGPGSHSNTDSVTDDGTFCGLCAKGPEAEENWESKGFYCFNGKVSIDCHVKYSFNFICRSNLSYLEQNRTLQPDT